MELNNVQNNTEDQDRFSKLPDDILIYILEKSDIHTSVRASFLSTRWRHLPSSLPHVSLNIADFIHSNNTTVNHIETDEAMSSITKAAQICFAAPKTEGTLKTVSLRLVLTAKYLYDIGKLVCQAIGNGEVKSVDLALPTEKLSIDCDEVDMIQHTKILIGFHDASSNLFRCLTRLFLHNTRFDELQMHRLLSSCELLQHLVLNNCDTGDRSVLKIDLPNSKILYLRLRSCCFEKVEFFCLPKLTELHYESWFSLNAPFSFGFVPCLEELHLICSATRYQSGHNLSELLHRATGIQTLTLDFQGEKVWMLPEGNKLFTLFNKLSKMFIHGIYVKFGLLWTEALLEAAPCLKTFGIKVWDHLCDDDDEESRRFYSKRTNPWQKNKKLNNSKHLHLTRLEFGGFMSMKKHVQFIRAVIDYAPNLETVLLEDKDHCQSCDGLKNNLAYSSTGSVFPKNKDEKHDIESTWRQCFRLSKNYIQVIWRCSVKKKVLSLFGCNPAVKHIP